MLDEPSDEVLLGRAREGEERAFILLYERHRDPVFRFAYRMLGSIEGAEDVAHDCFLGLMTRPLRFDPTRASLRTYLCAAARNLSFKRLRAEARERFDDEAHEPAIDGAALTDLLEHEVAREVQGAVSALPPLQREVVLLVEYESLSLAEVAEIVGTEVGTVKARLHRAREGLRHRLESLRPRTAAGPQKGDRA
ncbi:MAG TPA: RNA polymerase sigma factor [Vicinamibacteria bacterium]|nr:RNA polymerase sigma factor [Vicinamibacteria bacterium]